MAEPFILTPDDIKACSRIASSLVHVLKTEKWQSNIASYIDSELLPPLNKLTEQDRIPSALTDPEVRWAIGKTAKLLADIQNTTSAESTEHKAIQNIIANVDVLKKCANITDQEFLEADEAKSNAFTVTTLAKFKGSGNIFHCNSK